MIPHVMEPRLLDPEGVPPAGHNGRRTVRLRVVTGLEDDRRRPLSPGDPLYADALAAYSEQDAWSLGEHAEWWGPLLVSWPRAGRPATVDHMSAAAAHLATFDLPIQLIAEALHVEPDTLRPRTPSRHRERPSIERGRELIELEPLSTRVRRLTGTLAAGDDRTPLPRVYADGDDEPDFTYFNPRVRLVDGSWRRAADAGSFAREATAALRELHAVGWIAYRRGGWRFAAS
jgi:hypothetical protein